MKNSIIDPMKRYSLFLHEEDIKKYKAIAKAKGINYTALIRMVLREYLTNLKEQSKK